MLEKLDELTNEINAIENDIQTLCNKKKELIKQREELIIKNKTYITDISQYKNQTLKDITVIVQKPNGSISFNNRWDKVYVDDKGHLRCTITNYYDCIDWFYDEEEKSYTNGFCKKNVIGFCDIKLNG